MGLLCLPIHIWDRELDARIVLAVLCANQGHDVILGHEYNISGLYKEVPNLYYLHNGRPTDSYRSKDWRTPIKENGGFTSLILEEGINEQSEAALKKHYVGVTSESLRQVDKLFCWTKSEQKSVHKVLQNSYPDVDISSKLTISSNTRLELLGSLGHLYFKNRIDGIHSMFGKFVLISDNFGIEQFGGKKPLDQTPRYKNILSNENEIEELLQAGREVYNKGVIARDRFCKVVNQLIKSFPDVLFIIRPHPVSDPRYWFNNISPSRNSYIFYRDSIEPWIHAASTIIHSGCTVGFQGELASVETIDISSLIQDDRSPNIPVSSSLSTHKVQTGKQLLKIIRETVKKAKDFEKLNSYKSKNATDERLILNQQTLNSKAMKFLESHYGLPSKSACLTHLESINNFFKTKNYQFEDDILKHLQKLAPNPNKSRYYAFDDIYSRVKAAAVSLNIQSNIKLYKTKSPNTFLIRKQASL